MSVWRGEKECEVKGMIKVVRKDRMALGCNTIMSYGPAWAPPVRQGAYFGTMISLALILRRAFFFNDFIEMWLVQHLKILQNKVEDACEISFSCDFYSYAYGDSTTIRLWVFE